MNPTDVAWAAGLFEGEGCIRMYRADGKTPQLYLSMADEDVVRRFHHVVGCGRVYGPYGPYAHSGGTKPQWAWVVGSCEKVQALIAQWWPWLGRRRRIKAREVLLEARASPVKAAYRTRCPRGHEYTGENLLLVTRRSADRNRAGKKIRVCRTCNYANMRRYRAAAKAAREA
jgi:hypothetical protein